MKRVKEIEDAVSTTLNDRTWSLSVAEVFDYAQRPKVVTERSRSVRLHSTTACK
jgi:hypothetical protein